RAPRHRRPLHRARSNVRRPGSGAGMSRAPDAALRESSRRDWRAAVREWGPAGNKRLTTSTALVLLVLLVVEALTTLALGIFLPVHIFLGLLLLPPVALKLS